MQQLLMSTHNIYFRGQTWKHQYFCDKKCLIKRTSYLLVFLIEQKVKFRQVSKNDPMEAIRLAFDTIEDMDDQQGKYMHLLHALEDAGKIGGNSTLT